MSACDELHYPNLTNCRMKIVGSAGSSKSPVQLPSNCLNAAKMSLVEKPYDFELGKNHHHPIPNLCMLVIFWDANLVASHEMPAKLDPSPLRVSPVFVFVYDMKFLDPVERSILKRKQAREHDLMLQKATSKEEIQEATLTKMKSVTGAGDDVCVAMLESKGYDLKTSIEAFYLEHS